MDHVIHFLRQRDTKSNIVRLQQEFDGFQSQISGKKQVVSLSMINKQLEQMKAEDARQQKLALERQKRGGLGAFH